ncbi:MAG: hypothetical protein QM692_21610 [Thermomicrobiales bacterium]
MRSSCRAVVLAIVVCLLPLWPTFAQDDQAEVITQKLLLTPFPVDLLTWNGGVSDPHLRAEEFQSEYEGFYEGIEINTGGASYSANERIGSSFIFYDVYREDWQAEQAYAAWMGAHPEWLPFKSQLDGDPFVSEAVFQAKPEPPYPTAVCATTVNNVVVFASAVSGDEAPTELLYGAVFGNCKAAVTHLRSLQ